MKKIPQSAAAPAAKSVKTRKSKIIIQICFLKATVLLRILWKILQAKYLHFTFYGKIWNTDYFRVWKNGVFSWVRNDGLVKVISSKWWQYPVFQAKLYRTNSMIRGCQQPLRMYFFLTALLKYNRHRRNYIHLKCTIWCVLTNIHPWNDLPQNLFCMPL